MRLVRKKSKTSQGLNLTSMIDIVFLLVIFFMVVSQFQKIELEKLELPRAEPAAVTPPVKPSRLVINVHANGRIIIERAEYTSATLRALLQKETEYAKGRPPAVLIRGDRTTPWKNIRNILRLCAEFGIYNADVGIEKRGE